MRVESEKMTLEKEKVVLETKLKQVTDHSEEHVWSELAHALHLAIPAYSW